MKNGASFRGSAIVMAATATLGTWFLSSHVAYSMDGETSALDTVSQSRYTDHDTAVRYGGVGNYIPRDGQMVQEKTAGHETLKEVRSHAKVLFPTNSAHLTLEGQGEILRISRLLVSDRHKQVEINGFADARGTHPYNMDLSRARAATIVQSLSKDGVLDSQMVLQSFGESQPIASNRTAEGRAENRRAEIEFGDDAG